MIQTQSPTIAILGLGNELLMDDGFGVHVIRELQKYSHEGVLKAEVGTAILHAIDILEDTDVIIAIDAIEGGDAPGTVYRYDLSNSEMADTPVSLHSLGIIGAMRLIPVESRPSVIVIGVEPETVDYGMELSECTRKALPVAVKAVLQIIAEITQTAPNANGRDTIPNKCNTHLEK